MSKEMERLAVEAVRFYVAVCMGTEHPMKTGNLNADLEVSRNAVLNRAEYLVAALNAREEAYEMTVALLAEHDAYVLSMRSGHHPVEAKRHQSYHIEADELVRDWRGKNDRNTEPTDPDAWADNAADTAKGLRER